MTVMFLVMFGYHLSVHHEGASYILNPLYNIMQPLKMSSYISDGEWHSFYINDKLNYYHNPIYKRKVFILNFI